MLPACIGELTVESRGSHLDRTEKPVNSVTLSSVSGTWLQGFTSHLKVQTCTRQGTLVAGLTPGWHFSSATALSVPLMNRTQDTALRAMPRSQDAEQGDVRDTFHLPSDTGYFSLEIPSNLNTQYLVHALRDILAKQSAALCDSIKKVHKISILFRKTPFSSQFFNFLSDCCCQCAHSACFQYDSGHFRRLMCVFHLAGQLWPLHETTAVGLTEWLQSESSSTSSSSLPQYRTLLANPPPHVTLHAPCLKRHLVVIKRSVPNLF